MEIISKHSIALLTDEELSAIKKSVNIEIAARQNSRKQEGIQMLKKAFDFLKENKVTVFYSDPSAFYPCAVLVDWDKFKFEIFDDEKLKKF